MTSRSDLVTDQPLFLDGAGSSLLEVALQITVFARSILCEWGEWVSLSSKVAVQVQILPSES